MKNAIFLILIIPKIAFSQPNDHTSKYSQPVNYQDSLVYSMISRQIAEMEINFKASFQLKKAETVPSLLDSTRTYQFNSLKDSVLVDRTLLTYNATGAIKNKSNYFWNDYYKMMLNNKYEYLYDKTGKLTTLTFNDWRFYHYDTFSPGEFLHHEGTNIMNYLSKYEYTYDRSGHQTSFIYRIYDENYQYWGAWAKTQDFYDAAGIRVSKISESHYELAHKEEYSYDFNKNLSGITLYNRTPDYLWFYSGKTQYDYTYGPDSRVTSVLSSYWSFKAGQWKVVSKVDYTYNVNGGLASRAYFIVDTLRNELVPANRTDFNYNRIDKIDLREDYVWNETSSQWELRKKQYYYYNYFDLVTHSDENAVSRKSPFFIFPNPAKDILWIENIGDLNSLLQIYNSHGQCVKTCRMEKGINTINLTALPRGIYFYAIPSKNGLHKSGQLIIE